MGKNSNRDSDTVFGTNIPTPEEIFIQVVHRLELERRTELYVRQNFESLLFDIMQVGLELLERYQLEAQRNVLRSLAGNTKEFEGIAQRIITESIQGAGSATERLSRLVVEAMSELPPLIDFSTSVANTRRARAGSMFQRAVRYLLEKCGISSDSGKPETGRSDVIIPNIETYRRYPERSALLELKAMTIRERWERTDISQRKAKGPVWIVTLDAAFGEQTAKHIEELGLRIYCPERLAKGKLRHITAVRPLSTLLDDITAIVAPTGSQTKL